MTANPIIEKNTGPPTKVANLTVPTKPEKFEIKSLVGLDTEKIQNMFGIPNFVRKDFGTQFWRYEGKDCRLNIAMYPKGTDTSYRVNYSETSDKNGRAIDNTHCLKNIFLKAQNSRD